MRRVRAFFLFTCCLLVAIGPLNLMQMIAWGNMLHDYSEDKTIAEAVDMTFGGDYPCEMCRRIAEAKAQDARDSRPDQPAPLPQEERSLRLIFQCDRNTEPIASQWISEQSMSPGSSDFLTPLPRFQRVPTPPPQRVSC